MLVIYSMRDMLVLVIFMVLVLVLTTMVIAHPDHQLRGAIPYTLLGRIIINHNLLLNSIILPYLPSQHYLSSQDLPLTHVLVHRGVLMNFDSGRQGCWSGSHVGTGPPAIATTTMHP